MIPRTVSGERCQQCPVADAKEEVKERSSQSGIFIRDALNIRGFSLRDELTCRVLSPPHLVTYNLTKHSKYPLVFDPTVPRVSTRRSKIN